MKQLVLSLFPGADLFGMAFEQEEFCVVRGPDILLGGDIYNWKAIEGKFDGVIGGPPCKAFSIAVASRGWQKGAKEGNLVPEFERIIREAKPKWFVMENVPRAPIPEMATWNQKVDAWEFGALQHRKRRFSSNLNLKITPISEEERHQDPFPCITATENKYSENSNERVNRQRAGRKIGRRLTIKEINVLMGLPENFYTPALKCGAAHAVRGNGVPLQMGRCIARAVKEEIENVH